MKFGLIYELQLPKPANADQWGREAERDLLEQTLEQIALADRLGYDYVFMVEHHFLEEFSHASAPELMLAAASQRTRRIRLGHGMVLTPPRYNHPARVAERLATLDLLSNGRAEFGSAASASRMELGGFGVPPEKKRAMMEEATRAICAMMVDTPFRQHRGDAFSMPERNVVPKPYQQPHPPLWMAASSEEAVYGAARLGMGPFAFSIGSPEELGRQSAEYYRHIRDACEPIGRAINPAIAMSRNMLCLPDRDEAREKGSLGSAFFSLALSHHYGAEHQSGRENLARRLQALPPETIDQLARPALDGGCIGTPDEVRETLLAYEANHLDLMLFLVQMGSVPHADILRSLSLFGTEVLPAFGERHVAHQAWRAERLAGVRHPILSSI